MAKSAPNTFRPCATFRLVGAVTTAAFVDAVHTSLSMTVSQQSRLSAQQQVRRMLSAAARAAAGRHCCCLSRPTQACTWLLSRPGALNALAAKNSSRQCSPADAPGAARNSRGSRRVRRSGTGLGEGRQHGADAGTGERLQSHQRRCTAMSARNCRRVRRRRRQRIQIESTWQRGGLCACQAPASPAVHNTPAVARSCRRRWADEQPLLLHVRHRARRGEYAGAQLRTPSLPLTSLHPPRVID